jgi:hypothetical protein
MWRIVQRILLPLVLLGVGIASLVYGLRSHTAEVFEEQEIEIALGPPAPPPPEPGLPPELGGMPGFPDPSGFGGMPGMPGMGDPMSPFGAPPPELQKVKQKIFVGKEEPEPVLVREITIGGLMRLATGELQRTYTGEPPSLCPT